MYPIENVYIDFFSFLKKPSLFKPVQKSDNIKIFLLLLPFSLLMNFGLDAVSNNPWLTNYLKITGTRSHNDILYKYGIVYALLPIGIITPVIEELLQRYYLTSCIGNNCFAPINVTVITIALLNVNNKYIVIALLLVAVIVSAVIYIMFKQSEKLRPIFVKFYTKNQGWYFYLSAISFGMAHILNFNTAHFVPFLPALLVLPQIFAGLILGYIRVILGLQWSMAFHALHNLYFLGLLFASHI